MSEAISLEILFFFLIQPILYHETTIYSAWNNDITNDLSSIYMGYLSSFLFIQYFLSAHVVLLGGSQHQGGDVP